MIKIIFIALAALFWLLAEYVSWYIQSLNVKDDKEREANFNKANLYFEDLYNKVKRSKLATLPIIAINAVLDAQQYLFKKITIWFSKYSISKSSNKEIGCLRFLIYLLVSILVFAFLASLFEAAKSYPDCIDIKGYAFYYPNGYAFKYAKYTFYIMGSIGVITILFGLEEKNFIVRLLTTAGISLIFLLPICLVIEISIILLDFVMSFGLWYAVIPLAVVGVVIPYTLFSIYTIFASGHVAYGEDETPESYEYKRKQNEEASKKLPEVEKSVEPLYPFFIGFFFSFVVSAIAMIIGQLLIPIQEHTIPLTVPMLFFNAISDGLTLAITISILKRLIETKVSSVIKVSAYILLDIICAGVLAIGSIMLGSLFQGMPKVNFLEAIELLMGYSFETGSFNISSGPHFFFNAYHFYSYSIISSYYITSLYI